MDQHQSHPTRQRRMLKKIFFYYKRFFRLTISNFTASHEPCMPSCSSPLGKSDVAKKKKKKYCEVLGVVKRIPAHKGKLPCQLCSSMPRKSAVYCIGVGIVTVLRITFFLVAIWEAAASEKSGMGQCNKVAESRWLSMATIPVRSLQY